MNRRKTKIVCTIGPATSGAEMIDRLVRAGMDVARLNFSHGAQAEHAKAIAELRAAAARHARPLAILQDLGGPKVRIGRLRENVVRLEPGASFTLTTRNVPGDAREVSVSYGGLPADVAAGDSLLLNDGAIELQVREVSATDIRCSVLIGGELPERKGINLPSRSVRVPFFTAKDRSDLAFGLQQGVDYVALSFVRDVDDVEQIRAFMTDTGASAPLLAKIEKHEALANIHAIMDSVDGIMVARGDLGVDIPLEHIPRVQKELIVIANRAGKPVITATQMLKSMVGNPRPTRAEVTDVANAILDGTDAVMLSEETAVGAYPIDSVEMMARIAREAEAALEPRYALSAGDPARLSQEAVAESAVRLADRLGAAALLTCTQSGSTTRLVARHRPKTPVVAATPGDGTRRRLALVWGAIPLAILPAESVEGMERAAVAAAKTAGLVRAGDRVVITAGVLHVPGTTNTIKVALVP